MPRWVQICIAIIIGIALGLTYGWVISPVQFIDVAPGGLHADYRLDTVLMTATIHHADQDVDAAAQRLTMLGSDPPVEIASQALRYGFENGLPNYDLTLIQELVTALQTWQPAGGMP